MTVAELEALLRAHSLTLQTFLIPGNGWKVVFRSTTSGHVFEAIEGSLEEALNKAIKKAWGL